MRRLQHAAGGLTVLAATLAAASATAAAAPSACKDLNKAACQREPACAWVDPYKRLDDVKVKGFCRATTATPAKPEGN